MEGVFKFRISHVGSFLNNCGLVISITGVCSKEKGKLAFRSEGLCSMVDAVRGICVVCIVLVVSRYTSIY